MVYSYVSMCVCVGGVYFEYFRFILSSGVGSGRGGADCCDNNMLLLLLLCML